MATIDIILPAFNPSPGWEEKVIDSFQSLKNIVPQFKFRLIIVNDGSTTILEKPSLAILKSGISDLLWIGYPVNAGKGYALRKGVEASDSDFVIYTDIDWPYSTESMSGLIHQLTQNADAVIGIRDEVYFMQLPPSRRLISGLLRKLNGRLLHLKVNDTQAGLKGFRQNLKQTFLSTTINRYLFDLEFIYLLSLKESIRIEAYPVSLREGISFSKVNFNTLLKEAFNFLKILLKNK